MAGESVPVVSHCFEDRDVVAAISRTAERLEASLVCLATHGRSRTAAIVGSTFAGLAAASSQPFVAVGPRLSSPGGPDPRRTVVALDDAPSPLTPHLVDQAAQWARALGHRLTFATVLHDGDRALAQATLRRLVADPELDDLEIDAVVLGAGHSPHHALALHLAEHPATFVAAATHGRSGPALAILGSETARIVHESPVPVLVVPPNTRHRPG
jgi:nucleotide-binding universal stress UspA family protein